MEPRDLEAKPVPRTAAEALYFAVLRAFEEQCEYFSGDGFFLNLQDVVLVRLECPKSAGHSFPELASVRVYLRGQKDPITL